MALIFALSSTPQLPHAREPLLDVLLKKGAHFSEYGILALLWLRALDPARLGLGRPQAAVAALLAAALYAISDETHQAFVPGRHPAGVDVLIDSAGASTAILLTVVRRRWVPGAARVIAKLTR
jgi:VanZ family protein